MKTALIVVLSLIVVGLVAYIASQVPAPRKHVPRQRQRVQERVYIVRDEPRVYWGSDWNHRDRHDYRHRRRHDHFVGRTEEGTTLDAFFATVPEVPQAVPEVPQAVPEVVSEPELIHIDDVQAFEDASGAEIEGFANPSATNKLLVGITIVAVALGVCAIAVPHKMLRKYLKTMKIY